MLYINNFTKRLKKDAAVNEQKKLRSVVHGHWSLGWRKMVCHPYILPA